MPTPRDDETRSEFMERCIPQVIHDGTADSNSQAVAICSSLWENRDKSVKSRDDDDSDDYWGWDLSDLVVINEEDGSETPMDEYLRNKRNGR